MRAARPAPAHALFLLMAAAAGAGAASGALEVPDPMAAEALQPALADSGLTENEFHLMPATMRPLPLAHGFVLSGSLRMLVDGQLWREGTDYRLRARTGLIVPLRAWRVVVAAPSEPAGARVPGDDLALVSLSYRFVPVPIASRLDLRPVSPPPFSSGPSSVADRTGFGLGRESSAIRGGSLLVSGSKSVQVSSGSRREMTVDQNLRLNISGQLTSDIAVQAFLSDDNLPVVPEGNTEQLKDIDKVLVRIQARNWDATLGDFVAERRGSAFGDFRRKLQGIDVRAHPGSSTVEVLAGSPRGVYRLVQIQGQESNQGPYRLGAGEGGRNLFVVAGSERVLLDGLALVRGADQDYVVDYVLGSVTFTYKRLITAESLITVEFEEGEGPYARTVLGGGVGHSIALPGGGGTARLSARITTEKDDPGRLRTGELQDTDQQVLAAAGDDALLAVAPGVTPTAPGAGGYDEQLSDGVVIYVFNPSGGGYSVGFYHAGAGLGDYTLRSLTAGGQRIFVYVGEGRGAWRIGRPLNLPAEHSLASFRLDVGDSVASRLNAEWNVSNVDRNLASTLDDGDNAGGAGRVDGQLSAATLFPGGHRLGHLMLCGSWEQRDARFAPLQVRRTVGHYEAWGLGERARRAGFLDESERQMDGRAEWRAGGPANQIAIKGLAGTLGHGDGLSADRRFLEAVWRFQGGTGRHVLERAGAVDRIEPLDINRRGRRHELSWLLGPVVPSVGHSRHEWRDGAIAVGRSSGFRLVENTAGLAARPGGALAWQLQFRRGLADSLRESGWALERDSRTAQGSVTTGSVAGIRLLGEGTWRSVLQPTRPDETTRLARLDLIGRWDRSASDWSLGYRVDNSRTEVLDRQIIFVGERQGNFDQDGGFLGIDQGSYDVVLAGTDSLVATTGVRSDLRWRQGFSFLGKDRWFGAWSTQTLAAIEGRSTTDRVGRLLMLDPAVVFADDTAVLGDLNFSEELTVLEHLPRVDLRGRFGYRQTRDRQFVDHPEDRLNRDWQTTGNFNLSRRTTWRLRWVRQQERRESRETMGSARRSQDILTRRWEAGWTFTPHSDLRLGLQAERVLRSDAASQVAQREYALRPTARARLRTGWTMLADARWSAVASDEPDGALRPVLFPYPGGNVESTLRLSWDPTRYLTVAASWFARRQGERGWQHDLRLESTARF